MFLFVVVCLTQKIDLSLSSWWNAIVVVLLLLMMIMIGVILVIRDRFSSSCESWYDSVATLMHLYLMQFRYKGISMCICVCVKGRVHSCVNVVTCSLFQHLHHLSSLIIYIIGFFVVFPIDYFLLFRETQKKEGGKEFVIYFRIKKWKKMLVSLFFFHIFIKINKTDETNARLLHSMV